MLEKDKIEKMILKAKIIGDIIKNFYKDIRIISHYDADGITSAAIMVKALTREEKSFHVSLIKQLNIEEIEKLRKEKENLILFLDFGSGQLDNIQNILKDKKIIVVDHHQIEGGIFSKNLFHLNPLSFGITQDISGSGISYILARSMNPENIDLSELAIIGAIGDSQIGSIGPDWGVLGLNKEILKDAVTAKKIKVTKGLRIWGRYLRPLHKALEYSIDPYIPGISGSESSSVQFLHELGIKLKNENGTWRTLSDLSDKEQKKLAGGIIKERVRTNEINPGFIFGDVYELIDKKEYRDANEFATILNATGKSGMGFLGVSLCLNILENLSDIKSVLNNYRKKIGKGLDFINKNKNIIKTMENAHYILAGYNISEDIISNVTSIVNNSGILRKKPIFAFVNTEDGKIKISARVPDSIKNTVNLQDIISKAALEVNGEGGGHKSAAGATIPLDSVQVFISFVEKTLKSEKLKDIEREEVVKIRHPEYEKETSEKMERKGLVQYFSTKNV